MAACRAGDTLVVAKLDRLARSVPDARDIVDELTARGVRLNLGGSIHDSTDPIGRLPFTVLSLIEADLARARTREGMAVAKAKGRLRGKQTTLSPKQEAHLVGLWRAGDHTTLELAELFNVPRSTVYRAIHHEGVVVLQADQLLLDAEHRGVAGDVQPEVGGGRPSRPRV